MHEQTAEPIRLFNLSHLARDAFEDRQQTSTVAESEVGFSQASEGRAQALEVHLCSSSGTLPRWTWS